MAATTTHRPGAGPRRADAGTIRMSQRDIDGLLLCAEHGAAPYDLLACALGVAPARLRGIVTRWRRIGYAATGRLGPGPAWCWLTAAGMTATGLRYPATCPALGRLAHLRAVLAARLWLQATTDWQAGPGGNRNGGSAPTSPPPGPGTGPTPRCTGRPCPAARMPGRSGPLRSS